MSTHTEYAVLVNYNAKNGGGSSLHPMQSNLGLSAAELVAEGVSPDVGTTAFLQREVTTSDWEPVRDA